MQNKLISNSIFSVGINLLVKSVWILGMELAVQRALGNEVYGKYFALFNFSMFFLLFTDFGINNYNTREISKNQLKLSSFADHLFTFKILLGLVYFCVLLLAGMAMEIRGEEYRYLILIGAIQFFSSLSLFFRSNLSGLHAFRQDAIIGISDKLMMIMGTAVFLFIATGTGSFSLWHFLWIQLGSFIVTNILGLIFLSKHIKFKLVKPDPGLYKKILRQGLPFSILFFTMTLYMRMDGVLLKALLPDGELQAGIYAAGFRLLDAFIQVTIIITGILLPILSKEISEKENISGSVFSALSLLITPALVFAAAGLFLHEPLARLLYPNNTEEISVVISILLPASVPYILNLVYGTILTAGGHFKALNTISFICLLLNIILHWILIPLYGYKGAAIVTGITHTCSFIGLGIISSGVYKVWPSKIYLLKTLLFASFTMGTCYLVQLYWSLPVFAAWCMLAGIAAFASGLIPIKNMLRKISGSKKQKG